MPPLQLLENTSPTRDRSRDKALLVAIEYKWPPFEGVLPLNTPHKDLERVRWHLMTHWGYHPQNITTLKDGPTDEVDENMVPTRANIFREIDNLVAGLKPGDRRVFFFAGHCYQIKNRSGTETDGKDEVILTAKHNGPPDETLDYGFAHPVRQGLVIDNELRDRLVNSIPCGAKLVAIADTCHSGTLFDLNWHWHCDTQDKLRTLPSSPPQPTPTRKSSHSHPNAHSRSSRRRHNRNKLINAKASEYTYQFKTTHEHEDPPISSSSYTAGGRGGRGEPCRVKTLFSSRAASWSLQEDVDMDDGECDSQKENQNTNNNNKGEGGSKSRSKPSKKSTGERPQSPRSPVEWGFTDMCPSPTEDLPHVMSISSAEDHQQAWSGSKEDTMTSLLIEIIEELNHREVTTQELTRLLNGRMQRIRRQTMEAYYEGRKGSIMAEGTVKILNKIQLPQLGGLRKDAPRTFFEL